MIHIITPTVSNLNIVFPVAAAAIPVITNLTSHYTFLNSWVLTIKPTWGMSTAMILRNTCLWNVITSLSSYAIPARRQISIAFKFPIVVTRSTVGIDEFFVPITFSCLP